VESEQPVDDEVVKDSERAGRDQRAVDQSVVTSFYLSLRFPLFFVLAVITPAAGSVRSPLDGE
jgi:hypothetical protein